MADTDIQNQVEAKPENGNQPSFRQHHAKLDAFVQECNDELRTRGLHACEAYVFGNWNGQAILRRSEMTNVRDPKTRAPITMDANVALNLPWLMPTENRQSATEVLNDGLHRADLVGRQQCAKHAGVMRKSFNAVAQQLGRIAVPPGIDVGR